MKRYLLLCLVLSGCYDYDLVIQNATIIDGSGAPSYVSDVYVKADTISFIGVMEEDVRVRTRIDATGLALTPGFINMLSWATESLLSDGRSMSDILQGVTLEVMGEGWSMGPNSDSMRTENRPWVTLKDYLDELERRGVSPNVASYVGASTVRIHVMGHENRAPTEDELARMQALVAQAMADGAVGLSTALIYSPGAFATTDEIIALAKAAAPYDGVYISHIRSEGNRLLEAIDELITISSEAGIRGEFFHLKTAGEANWPKQQTVLDRIEAARNAGVRVSANMYPYTAASTSLTAIMPPDVMEDGHDAWVSRLSDPIQRAEIKARILETQDEWENFYQLAGDPERIVLVGFRNDSLQMYSGLSLAEIARRHGKDPIDTAMDLVVMDDSRVGAVYFLMSEENVRSIMSKDWVSFGSDSGSFAAEGDQLLRKPHPRAYGSFARVLGHYARDEQVMSMEEAVRRLTSLPASNLRLERRGLLKPGYYADLVLFDPNTIIDNATFSEPHQYATGVHHVFVNGVQVVRDGAHTGKFPGRALSPSPVRSESIQ
jgi:N-acyl-D-amino-acid deacylase